MLSSHAEMEGTGGNEEWERIDQPATRKRVQNRLSQRRHREKIRQQREPATQEIIIPPSFTSSYMMDEEASMNDYPSPSFSFNGQDDRHNLPRSNQPQEEYDAFDAFNAQDILPRDQTVSNTMTQHAQPGAVGMSRAMTPHMGRPAMSSSFQLTSMRPPGSLAPARPSLLVESRNEHWDSHDLSDPQWAIPGFQQNPAPVSNPPNSTNNSRQMASHMSRPVARPMPRRTSRRTSSASSSQQMNAPPTPRTLDSYSSPISQRNIANQAYPRSSTHLENTNTAAETPRHSHDACSHCRTCQAPHAFDDQNPGRASPRTPASTPSQDSSQASSEDHFEILANCSKMLANLARQSDIRDENEPVQRPRSSKRNRSNLEGSFGDRNGTSEEDDLQDGHFRRNVVGNVVILCMKNGKKTKGK